MNTNHESPGRKGQNDRRPLRVEIYCPFCACRSLRVIRRCEMVEIDCFGCGSPLRLEPCVIDGIDQPGFILAWHPSG